LIVAELMLAFEPLSTTVIGPNFVPLPAPHPVTQLSSDVANSTKAIDETALFFDIVVHRPFRMEPRRFIAQTKLKRFIFYLVEHRCTGSDLKP
jgi:hypothetical protein